MLLALASLAAAQAPRENKEMALPTVASYGSWKSPITSELIVSESIGLGQLQFDGEDIYWVEARPTEEGRQVIVRKTPDGKTRDVIPKPFNARNRVHEYGGRDYVVHQWVVYFSNFADQRIYRVPPEGKPEPITPDGPFRYADGVIAARQNRMITVREDHTASEQEATNSIVSVDLDGKEEVRVLVEGHDFYASPRLSPDATRLAWLAWNHPNMPWDETELWVAELAPDGALSNAKKVAGEPGESIAEPNWAPDGTLYFVSDCSGWWNLYRLRDGGIEAVLPMEAEFTAAQWLFGQSHYAFESSGSLLCCYTQRGRDQLARLDLQSGELESLGTSYVTVHGLHCAGAKAGFWAGSSTEPGGLILMDLASGEREILRRSMKVDVAPGYLSLPEAIEFPTSGGRTAHGFYYAPRNQDYEAPEGQLPPLLLVTHGGPTSRNGPAFSLSIQYWTSRGFAVFDVNYGGSTGYGREYRKHLEGNWGIVDVEDCAEGALALAKAGKVDPGRLAIRGGSAGGFTTLAALTFQDVFKAGASYYGVSDLEALTKETHKFESRYLDRLIGPYPERRALYLERSPIHHAERLSCPVIFFQGLEDKIVPPNQAETMVKALRENGIPVAYVAFEQEQHGFRKAENIKRALDAELYFYSKVFGFELPEPAQPVEIENL